VIVAYKIACKITSHLATSWLWIICIWLRKHQV